jgi:hypothetical protein
MMFKRGILVSLLALFLAACGTQTQAPAMPTAEEGLGEINVAELEAAFDATALTDQSNWNKKKYNKFTLKKVVEGYGPEHQVYKLAVICKVPNKKNVLAVVGAAYLKDGQSKHFLVPVKYVKCAAFEFEKFGDEVKFELKQKKYDQYSDVEYYGKIKLWGKKLDFKASEFFHLKRGDAKFIVINKYKKVEAPKKLELIIKKKFESEYNHDDYGKVKVQLVCKDYASEEFYLGDYEERKLELHYDYKDCYLKEAYDNDHYTLKHVSFGFDYYDDKYDTSKDGYVDGNYATSPTFELKTYYKKLVIVITNKVEKKPQKIDIVFKKVLHREYKRLDSYDVFKIVLYCGEGYDKSAYTEVASADLSKGHLEAATHVYDLYGKHCYVKESFYNDDYKLKKVTFHVNGYPAGEVKSDDGQHAYSDTFKVEDAYKLVIVVKNKLKKYHADEHDEGDYDDKAA